MCREIGNGNDKIRLSQVIRFRMERIFGEELYVERGARNFCTSYFWLFRVADMYRMSFHKTDLLFGSSGTTWKSRRVATDVPRRLLNPPRAFPYPKTRNYFGRGTCAISCTSVCRAAWRKMGASIYFRSRVT